MYNLEIRLQIKQNRLRNYEIAKVLNISEFTFSRWLREELVLSAIDKLIGGEHNE